jgi:hypothetical protein
MEHIVKTNGNKSALSAATLAIVDMQLSNPQDTGGSTSQREEADKEPCTNPEIVTLETMDMSGSDTEDTWGLRREIVVLDATDMSDPESDESDGGWMCILCKAVFATEKQWDDTCSAPTTPPPQRNTYCHTCQTVFNSEERLDRHEPCPEEERESVTRAVMAVTIRVAKKSRDTKSPIDQILCRYCKEHLPLTLLSHVTQAHSKTSKRHRERTSEGDHNLEEYNSGHSQNCIYRHSGSEDCYSLWTGWCVHVHGRPQLHTVQLGPCGKWSRDSNG